MKPTARSRASPRSTPRMRPQEPVQEAPRTVTLADPRVTQPSMSSLLSGALGRHRSPRRKRSARRCSSTSWARARTAVSTGRWSVGKRIAVSAGASYDGTALDATRLSLYGTPQARNQPAADRGGDRCRARRADRQGRDRRGAGTLQEPDDRRCGLCAGQPSHARAMVWHVADDRPDRRAGSHLARPHPRRHRRRRARGRSPLARQAPLRHRLSASRTPGRRRNARERVAVHCSRPRRMRT